MNYKRIALPLLLITSSLVASDYYISSNGQCAYTYYPKYVVHCLAGYSVMDSDFVSDPSMATGYPYNQEGSFQSARIARVLNETAYGGGNCVVELLCD